MKLLLSLFAILLTTTFCNSAPPNVVLIIGDDQHYGDYGFMGHPHIQTPHLDKLKSESLAFKTAYVPTSLCRASLATMVTGLYPHQHGITSNDPALPKGLAQGAAMKNEQYLKDRAGMIARFEQNGNLAKWFGAKGYTTFQAGKWWEGNACRCGGFTEGMTHGDTAKGGRHGDIGLTIGREGLEPVKAFINTAVDAKKPFFVWYAPMMPHTPHNPPERLFSKYKGKHKSDFVTKYWAMCEWFDETVGDVLKHLKDTGVADNTVVVYLHDNGWIQDTEKGVYAPRSKRSPYDGGLRTPILIKWPGHIQPGESTAIASSIDVVPTVLNIADIEVPKNLPGISLLDAKALAKREAVFGAIFTHNAIDIEKPAKNVEYRWVMSGGWKLIVPELANTKGMAAEGELYEVAKDPTEQKNLITEQKEKAKELRAKLDAWWPGK